MFANVLALTYPGTLMELSPPTGGTGPLRRVKQIVPWLTAIASAGQV